MTDFATLFDSLYSKLVLRDFLAKIVPGAIAMGAIALLFLSPMALVTLDIPLFVGLLLVGAMWLIGLTLQACAIRLGVYHNNDGKDPEKRRLLVMRASTTQEQMLLERYVVIKEAYGNGASAAAVLMFCLIGRPMLGQGSYPEAFAAFALLPFIFVLYWNHKKAMLKEMDFQDALAGLGPPPSP